MENEKKTQYTEEGYEKLVGELDYLKNERRPEIKVAIAEARAFGDLSENSEYDEAKNEQAAVEQRIADIEAMLKNIKVINEHEVRTDAASVGTTVKVYDTTFEEEVSYTLVGSNETNPLEYKISEESPIGRALIGAVVGETVKAETPGGEIEMKILEISKAAQ